MHCLFVGGYIVVAPAHMNRKDGLHLHHSAERHKYLSIEFEIEF